MKKKIVSILMAITTVSSMGIFSGCNEQPETSVGASGKNLTDVISEAKEDSTENTTEEIAATTDSDPMVYLSYLNKTVADATADFDDLDFDSGYPKTLTGDVGCNSYACPEEGVWFRYSNLTDGNCDLIPSKVIEEVWIDNPEIMNKIISQSIKSPDSSETYFASYNDVSYELLYSGTFISVMNSDSDEEKINIVKNGIANNCSIVTETAISDYMRNYTEEYAKYEFSYLESDNVVVLNYCSDKTDKGEEYWGNTIYFKLISDYEFEISKIYINDSPSEIREGSHEYVDGIAACIFGYEEPQTEPPASSSNSYGIYVTGNTDLAEQAGNTLVDKASFCGYADESYGYVFTYGDGTK